MEIYLAFSDYIDLGDINDQDGALELIPIENPSKKMRQVFKTDIVFETPEQDFDKILNFIKRNLYNKQSSCEILATNKDFTVQNRRVYNLHTEQPVQIDPGDYIALSYFWSNETQLINKSYEMGNHKIYILACGNSDSEFSVQLCCQYAEPEHLEVNTRRESLIKNHFQEYDLPFGYMPNKAVVDGREIELSSQQMMYCHEQDKYGQLLYEYLKQLNCLPAELYNKSLVFVDCSSHKLSEQVCLPIQSFTIVFHEIRKNTLIQKPFTSIVGNQDEKINYGYSETGEKLFLYIEGLRLIDVLEGVEDPILIEQFENLCPRDKRLLVLAYENPYPEYSPMFYRREYLESSINHRGEAYAQGWICGSDETGVHGFPLRFAAFDTVDSHFASELQLELLQVVQRLPHHEDIKILK